MNNCIIIFSIFLVFLIPQINAQQVEEISKVMSLGTENAFLVQIDAADETIAEKTLKEFLKPYGKIKWQRKFKEYQLLNTPIAPISGSNNLDLYVKIQQHGSEVSVMFWARTEVGFVSTLRQQEVSKKIHNFIQNYKLTLEKNIAENAWKLESDLLQKMEKELKKLQENNKNYHHDIQKAKERIAEAEKNIEQNLKQQEVKTQEILDQHIRVQKAEEKFNNAGKKQ